jgi:hypothetical protein
MELAFRPVSFKAKLIYFLAVRFGSYLSRDEDGLVVSGYFWRRRFYPVSLSVNPGAGRVS